MQKTLGEVLSQNALFIKEVVELKASWRASNRKLANLQAKVTKLTEENVSLRNELEQSRLRVNTPYEEKHDLWDSLDSLECIREIICSKFTARLKKLGNQPNKKDSK